MLVKMIYICFGYVEVKRGYCFGFDIMVYWFVDLFEVLGIVVGVLRVYRTRLIIEG